MMKMIIDIKKTILMIDNIEVCKYDDLNLMMLTKIQQKILFKGTTHKTF